METDITLIRKEPTLNFYNLNTCVLTHTALTALKNAYEKCSDLSAKESILSASNAITLLHYDLGKYNGLDKTSESDSGYDPSEYCAAV